MFNIDVTISLIALFPIILIAGLIGYAFKSGQVRKKQMKVVKLRKEIVSSHAYILELQKECVDLENQLNNSRVSEIPLKTIGKDFHDEDRNVVSGLKTSESLLGKKRVNHLPRA